MKKKVNELFLNCSALLICSYKLDINKNYKTYLTKNKIKKCLISYKVENEIMNYTNSNYNLTGKVYYLRNTADSECMIVINKSTLYLVFCGTEISDPVSAFKDIMTDINVGIEIVPEFGKNVGFHNPYIKNMNNDNLIERIKKIVSKYLHMDIIICGHSMGCGLALYTTLILQKKFSNTKFKLITIEAPKLGNDGLKKYLNNVSNIKHYDIINNNDFAPSFPYMCLNYCHIANKTYLFNNNATVEIKKDISRNIFLNHSIKEHFMNNVIKNIYDVLILQ